MVCNDIHRGILHCNHCFNCVSNCQPHTIKVLLIGIYNYKQGETTRVVYYRENIDRVNNAEYKKKLLGFCRNLIFDVGGVFMSNVVTTPLVFL